MQMSEQTTQPERSGDFANFTIPPREDDALPREGSAHPDTHPDTPHTPLSTQPAQRRGKSPEGAARPMRPGAFTHDPLDDAVALANILAAPLDPVRALGEAL